jgi:hypothetical protein
LENQTLAELKEPGCLEETVGTEGNGQQQVRRGHMDMESIHGVYSG